MKSLRLKKLIITRAIGIFIVILLIVLVIYAAKLVQGVRIQLMERQIKMEESLDEAVRRAVVADTLVQYEKEMKRVRDLVPWRDEIGQVVETVDGEAKRWGVAVLVPKISEEPIYNESGAVIEQTGPTRLIRLTVEAAGSPWALINLLHSLENLPYLMSPASYVLDNEADEISAFGATALAPALPPSEDTVKTMPVKLAILKADFLLTVRVEEDK